VDVASTRAPIWCASVGATETISSYQRAAVLAADAMREVGETASIMGAKILSTMGVPLWKGEEILGVLQVDNRAQRARDLQGARPRPADAGGPAGEPGGAQRAALPRR
jgi:hypothetical protein